jgi:hypothetical protein
VQADLTLMHVNIDNGYDAWSIYNTYTTYSNEPGGDAQLSNGAALRLVDSIDRGRSCAASPAPPARRSSIRSTAIGATIRSGRHHRLCAL